MRNDSFVSQLAILSAKYRRNVVLHFAIKSRAAGVELITYLTGAEPLAIVDAVVDLADPELLEERVLGLAHQHAHPPHAEQLHRRQTTTFSLVLS